MGRSSPCPSSKRRRLSLSAEPQQQQQQQQQQETLATLLSDEVLLRILAYLTARDLTRLQAVSHRISRLAEDPQLWKSLFIRNFIYPRHTHSGAGRSRHRLLPLADLRLLVASAPHQAQNAQRQIRGLPRRYLSHEHLLPAEDRELLHDGLDWQALYRVSSNWQKGNYAISELLQGAQDAPLDVRRRQELQQPLRPRHISATGGSRETHVLSHYIPADDDKDVRPETLVQSSSDFIFTASRTRTGDADSVVPHVDVYLDPSSREATPRLFGKNSPRRSPQPHEPAGQPPLATLRSSGLEETASITDLCICSTIQAMKGEQTLLLFVSYSNGAISIFEIRCALRNSAAAPQVEWHEALFDPAKTSKPIVMSSFHWPLLVTCTSDFSLAFHRLSKDSTGKLHSRMMRQMRSLTCHWPATMTLRPSMQSSQEVEASAATPRRSFADLKRKRSQQQPDTTTRNTDGSAKVFRLDIAYCTPSYPDNWTASLQEITIKWTDDDIPEPRDVIVDSRYATARPRVVSSQQSTPRRHVAKDDYSSDSSDSEGDAEAGGIADTRMTPPRQHRQHANHQLTPRSIFAPLPPRMPTATAAAPAAAAAANRIQSISYYEPFLVTGLSDNTIEVYEVSHASPASSTQQPALALPPLRLDHRHVLYGHMGSVLSVALEESRCVSGGSDGTVMVWTLGEAQAQAQENDTGTGALPMQHIVTLKGARRNDDDNDEHTTAPASHTQGQRPSAIKWVSTAFDRVLSVSSSSAPDGAGDDAREQRADTQADTSSSQHARPSGERVQVWSFAD